jgi:hypothetical protein
VGSPCVDAGADDAVDPTDTDFHGNPRISGAHVDIGANEYVPTGAFTVPDAARALRLAAGIVSYANGDSRLDVSGQGRVDLANALRLVRKATGLDPNP